MFEDLTARTGWTDETLLMLVLNFLTEKHPNTLDALSDHLEALADEECAEEGE